MAGRELVGKTIGHYQVDKLLGQGGMATVFEATDTKLNRKVALKIMHSHIASQEAFQERFMTEAQLAAGLDHPNIVPIFAVENIDDELFIVMNLITGGSLRQHLKTLSENAQLIGLDEVVELSRQLAEALHYAHQRNMTHRDVKPDNVLLKPTTEAGGILDYVPILTDFGLAKLTVAEEDMATAEQPIGTYPYMSPEQCRADTLDARTDIYSLGIVMYELAVGRLPFQPKSIAEANKMHNEEAIRRPGEVRSGFPEDLEQIILKCLEKNQNARYQTARELAQALGALQVKDEPITTQAVAASAGAAASDTEPIDFVPDGDLPEYTAPPLSSRQARYDRFFVFSEEDGVVVESIRRRIMTIGRGADQNIQLDDPTVSKHHAKLERGLDKVYRLTDLNTTNGTWVDGAKLPPNVATVFEPDQVLQIGKYWLVLELKDSSAFSTILDDEDEVPASPPDIASAIDLDAPVDPDAPTIPPPTSEATPSTVSSSTDNAMTLPPGAVEELSRLAPRPDEPEPEQIDTTPPDVTAEAEAEPETEPEKIDTAPPDVTAEAEAEPEPETVQEPEPPPEPEPEPEPEKQDTAPPEPEQPAIPEPRVRRRVTRARVESIRTQPMTEMIAEDIPYFDPPELSAMDATYDRIVVYKEGEVPRVCLLNQDEITIGRNPVHTLILSSNYVSRHHAIVRRYDDNTYMIVDIGSTNGVWLGNRTIEKEVEEEWQNTEVVRIGDYWLSLEYSEEQAVLARQEAMRTDLMEQRGDAASIPNQVFTESSVQTHGEEVLNHVISGRYQLTDMVGKNSIASVYKAADKDNNDAPLAVKLIHPYLVRDEFFVNNFFLEAQIARNIDHPNIVKVQSYEQSGDYLLIVMEFVEGPTLRQYLNNLKAKGERPNYGVMADFSRQIASAMNVAHVQGLYYRDLKPENIVLRETTERGETKYTPVLTDFALAQMVQQSDVYLPGGSAADYIYMTPERCLGQKQDERSDIYEVGIVMYEAFLGRPPYEPRSLAEATRMHTRMPLTPPSTLRGDIPLNLERILTKALEKNIDDRYQDANSLAEELEEVALALSGSTRQYRTEVDDPLDTAVMSGTLDPEMPYYPPQEIAEEDARYDRLIAFSELFPVEAFTLDRNVITIGRSTDQAIVLESNTVSRTHARIERNVDGSYQLIAAKSTNGTYLNDAEEPLIPDTSHHITSADTIRIGEYWLRIENIDDRFMGTMLDTSYGEGAETPEEHEAEVRRKFVATRDLQREGVVARLQPRLDLAPPEHDLIGFVVDNPRIRVAPGSMATISIEILNQSDIVEHYTVEVDGLPSEWVQISPAPVYLHPNNRGTTSVTIKPPLASSSTEGEHAFSIRINAATSSIASVAQQCAVEVEPFRNFLIDFQPPRVTGRGGAELKISNTGNTHDTYTLEPRDREAALDFVLPGKQFTLAPGKVEYVPMRIKPKNRPLTGRGTTLPFEIQVHSQHEATPPQTTTGEFVVTSRFPLWFLGCLGLLMLLLCILITAGSFWTYRSITNARTQAAIATSTASVFDITRTAEADPDEDGLPTFREATLQSDPFLFDTDGDGLNDRDEALVWQTTPINRDSDGDTLTDGDEVNIYGTNPLNPDTDGDGIPDAEDLNPVMQATPTVTPFPTAEGGCPGSPPENLAVGDFGRITEGGVNNRLRDNPGVEAGEIIGLMPPGSAFTVIGGPVCDPDQFILWWEVDYQGTTGWTASGEGEEYYVEPAEAGSGGGGGGGGSAGPSGASEEERAATDELLASLPEANAANLDRSLMGVQVDPTDAAIGSIAQIGVGWVKIQVSWAAIQPAGADDINDNFRNLQQFVESADGSGLNVLLSITTAPSWARSTSSDNDGPPDNPDDLAVFVTLLLREMGGSVDAIEVWNEPNLIREWDGALPFTGEGYMTLFAPAYDAIRTFSPDITVVTAGLAPTNSTDGVSVNDRAFLNQMYAGGLADYTDIAIGVHPYGWGNAPDVRCCDDLPDKGWDDAVQFFFINTLEDYNSITTSNSHDVELWATEFGWATWEGFGGDPPEPWMVYNTLSDQEVYTVRAFQIGQALDYVGPMFLWNLNFANEFTVPQSNEVIAYSMIIIDNERPVFNTLAAGQ